MIHVWSLNKIAITTTLVTNSPIPPTFLQTKYDVEKCVCVAGIQVKQRGGMFNTWNAQLDTYLSK